MRIRMQGFIVTDFATRFAEARKDLSTWLAEGKIKRKDTIIKGGLAAAEKGLAQLYEGINTGMSHLHLSHLFCIIYRGLHGHA